MENKLLTELQEQKNRLEKVIQAVEKGWQYFRPPYHKHSLSIKDHLSEISRNLDRLSEQVQ